MNETAPTPPDPQIPGSQGLDSRGPGAPRRETSMRGVAITAALLAAIGAAGLYLIFGFVAESRERDLRAWQDRLAIVADSRSAAVQSWLARQFDTLDSLAENESLQIYMTELQLAGNDARRVTAAEAQLQYLRSLLALSAARDGFRIATAPRMRANVRPVGTAGLALVNPEGQIVAAAGSMPPPAGALAAGIARALKGERALIDIHRGTDGQPAIAFALPIRAIQGDGPSNPIVGAVAGLKPLDDSFLAALRQPGLTTKSAEIYLVRQGDGTVEYLTPLKDAEASANRRLSIDTAELDAAFAIAQPGAFAIRRDAHGREVLVTGRAIAETPWTLVHTVFRDEALADTDSRARRLTAGLALGLGLLGLGALALWRHGASRRAADAAERHAALATRFASQTAFLAQVTDSEPDAIFIVDADGRYRFANRAAATLAGAASSADMIGKTIAAVLGPDAAKRHRERIERMRLAARPVTNLTRLAGNDDARLCLLSTYSPLDEAAGHPEAALVVERDISTEIGERERREQTLRNLVRALVTIIDRRDPFAADHSVRVGRLSRAIAEEMGLDPILAETVEFAGNLMNLGKLLVPTELLTRSSALTEDERQRVRESLKASADLLKGIAFDGPLVETLRQIQEHWDGSGTPEGLKGEAILITARIVAAANAFVAMISSRAYRPGIDMDVALDSLLAECGTVFDRRVVAALVSYIDSRGGRAAWTQKPTGT